MCGHFLASWLGPTGLPDLCRTQFGLPLAVTSFNRYSKFVEACGRRLGSVLVSMYFDDATITDWASSKGSGQFTFGRINQLLGTPFADEKRQAMQAMQASSWGWSMTFPLACLQVSFLFGPRTN